MAIRPIGYQATSALPKMNAERIEVPRLDDKTNGAGDVGQAKGAKGPTFADMLKDVVNAERTADVAAHDYSVGRTQDLHGTMIALQKADISFRLLATVRNKVLDAYREIMRMG